MSRIVEIQDGNGWSSSEDVLKSATRTRGALVCRRSTPGSAVVQSLHVELTSGHEKYVRVQIDRTEIVLSRGALVAALAHTLGATDGF